MIEQKESSTSQETPPSPAEIDRQIATTAKLIAEKLNETKKAPRALIYTIVKTYGIEKSLEQLQRTIEIEANGGVMTTR